MQGTTSPETRVETAAPGQCDMTIMQLFQKYEAIHQAVERYVDDKLADDSDMDDLDEEMDRLFYAEMERIEARIMALPSQSAADLAAKMIVYTNHGNLGCGDWETGDLWQEARALTGGAA